MGEICSLVEREVALFTADRTLLAFIRVNISHCRHHLHVTETQVHPLKRTSSEPCRHAVTQQPTIIMLKSKEGVEYKMCKGFMIHKYLHNSGS